MIQLPLTLCGVLLHACDQPRASDGGRPPYFDHTRFQPGLLRGEILTGAPVIGRPVDPGISGQRLWIADAAQDPSVHMLDMGNGELLMSMGRKGEGPGDFSARPHLHVRPGDTAGAIWTWDRPLQRLTRLDPEAPLTDPTTITVEPGPGGLAYRVVWLEPDRLVGIHASEETRFSLLSASGERLRSVPGELLGPKEVSQSLRMRQTTSGFYACPWPGRGFVMIYFRVGRIEFYDREAQLVRLADVPFASEAFTEDPEGDFVPAPDRNYYRSCAVHDDRLFAGFSGRADSDYEDPTPASYAIEFLHVFDWDGVLRQVYALEPEIHAIAIAGDGGVLFGTSLNTAAIYRYPLRE
jgi:hypothetical protein